MTEFPRQRKNRLLRELGNEDNRISLRNIKSELITSYVVQFGSTWMNVSNDLERNFPNIEKKKKKKKKNCMAKQRIFVFACQSQHEQLIIGKIRPKKAKSCHGISAGSVNETALH